MELAGMPWSELAPNEMQSIANSRVCSFDHQVLADTPGQITRWGDIRFGGVDLYVYEGVGVRNGNRSPHHIRNDQQDDIMALVPQRSCVKFYQSGKTTLVEPGSFAFLSTAMAFVSSIASPYPQEPFSYLGLKISGPLLRQRIPNIDDCCGQAIKIQPGPGQIMHSMFELAVMDGKSLSEDQANKFGLLLIDATANAACSTAELVAEQSQTHRSRWHGNIKEAAISVIDRNLSNPMLDAALIAEACKVSVRYLQSIFAESGHTVGWCIREARLQECRKALQSHELRHRSIIEIAMLWGFSDAAYFCRAYKARFGKTPKEDRPER